MLMMAGIFLAATLSKGAAAEQICVVGASVGVEKGQLSFASQDLREGSQPIPIIARDGESRRVLETAATEMDSSMQVCMTGKLVGRNFAVTNVRYEQN